MKYCYNITVTVMKYCYNITVTVMKFCYNITVTVMKYCYNITVTVMTYCIYIITLPWRYLDQHSSSSSSTSTNQIMGLRFLFLYTKTPAAPTAATAARMRTAMMMGVVMSSLTPSGKPRKENEVCNNTPCWTVLPSPHHISAGQCTDTCCYTHDIYIQNLLELRVM